jgi:hypothetical protein
VKIAITQHCSNEKSHLEETAQYIHSLTFLHNNAHSHKANVTTQFLGQFQWECLASQPYRPDMAQNNFLIFFGN